MRTTALLFLAFALASCAFVPEPPRHVETMVAVQETTKASTLWELCHERSHFCLVLGTRIEVDGNRVSVCMRAPQFGLETCHELGGE